LSSLVCAEVDVETTAIAINSRQKHRKFNFIVSVVIEISSSRSVEGKSFFALRADAMTPIGPA